MPAAAQAEVYNDLWLLLDQVQQIYSARMSFAFSRFTHVSFVSHLIKQEVLVEITLHSIERLLGSCLKIIQ